MKNEILWININPLMALQVDQLMWKQSIHILWATRCKSMDLHFLTFASVYNRIAEIWKERGKSCNVCLKMVIWKLFNTI